MEELLKTSFFTYFFLTVILGIWILSFVVYNIKKIKDVNNKILKILRIIACLVCISLWLCFVYANTYPVTLAYYEYKYEITEETVGIVNSIEQKEKDIVLISIDNLTYSMVYSSKKSHDTTTKDIAQGDKVLIQSGKHSMYIFSIVRMEKTEDGSLS